MSGYGMCDMCGGRLEKVDTRQIGGSEYVIMKCGKCNRFIARSKPPEYKNQLSIV